MTADVHALELLPADNPWAPGLITADGCDPTCQLASIMNTSMMCIVEDTLE
jgi:hypothetical protein